LTVLLNGIWIFVNEPFSKYRQRRKTKRHVDFFVKILILKRNNNMLTVFRVTMVRKSELLEATWDEVDFENAVWSIPKERMKRGKPHNVYLSQQSLDIMIALKTCAANSRYVLPSRYDADETMSKATFNRITMAIMERAKRNGLALQPFTVHDLRRTGSTLLHELGFNSDWIEKCLAHEERRSSRSVYNKAEYEQQRRHMLQEWADMIDAWGVGQKRSPVLYPPWMHPAASVAA
jgi:integrase